MRPPRIFVQTKRSILTLQKEPAAYQRRLVLRWSTQQHTCSATGGSIACEALRQRMLVDFLHNTAWPVTPAHKYMHTHVSHAACFTSFCSEHQTRAPGGDRRDRPFGLTRTTFTAQRDVSAAAPGSFPAQSNVIVSRQHLLQMCPQCMHMVG